MSCGREVPVCEIPKRSRREIARALERQDLFQRWDPFAELLQDIFVIRRDPGSALFGGERDLLDSIHRHFVRFPEDARVEDTLEQLGAFEISDKRFGMLLEGLASADVQVDVDAQLAIVKAINPVLLSCGAELRQTDEAGGYPVYSLVALRTARGRPKNLIFASRTKPDLRISDAVNNDVEILSDPAKVLVYDRPLGTGGLRWSDLHAWWQHMTGESDPKRAKNALYRRLLDSLPESSPPQRLLFESYFRAFGAAIPGLPALLPEVWLHWDPKTVKERGAQALLNHRMDMLMLMPGGGRVVLEVDGVQHYADESGRADPRQYARLARGDRELKLAGYEVYRFGGAELKEADATGTVKEFFQTLFRRHGVEPK